ncbi:hypothetical protein Tco_0926687 [Tanacetum coccineum]|uniref:CCHC-type domain-containing protein n=1 Tax=Tanacetum coccineum TaxID=301880 RepID=A0ABQ5DDA8_9ASTR
MASHRSKTLYAIKECSTCGSLYTKDCCSIRSFEDMILVPVPDSSPRCARCGTPVDGPSCHGCAFLRKKFEEDMLTYCIENGIFKGFEEISESSDDNTNVVNAPREPFVVNQDPGVKSSQDPLQIDHNCCYECGDSLDGVFCRQCICKSCGKGAHYGYNCPPKDPINSKSEPCNQTINEIPQTLPSLDPSYYSLPHVSKPNFVDHVNDESDLLESLIHRDTSIDYSSKIDPLFEEFAVELAHIAPIPPGIVEADFDPNDDTSSDDDDFEDIEYICVEEVNNVDQEEKEFDLEDVLQIQDVILREKLLNVKRLIANIESLNDNTTPDHVLNSPSPFPISVVDSDSFFEESDTSLSYSGNSLPEFESFSDHTEEMRSGSTTSHANYSLPEIFPTFWKPLVFGAVSRFTRASKPLNASSLGKSDILIFR